MRSAHPALRSVSLDDKYTLNTVRERTRYTSGCAANEKFGGDPSPVTACGVFLGIKEAVRFRHNTDLLDVRVAIQRVGNVGAHLARMLVDAGAKVIVADANNKRAHKTAARLGAAVRPPQKVLSLDVDVLAPCAMGAAINSRTIDSIHAGIVAGAANNQLESTEIGMRMLERGILYAPDYVINAGGIINIYYQQPGIRDQRRITMHLDIIKHNLAWIFAEAKLQQRPTNIIADESARRRLMATSDKSAAA